MLSEALAELVREAGGEALLLDAKHSRAIVSDTARLVDICRNLRHHGFTRFVDFTGEHLGDGGFALRLALRCPAHGHALLGLKWKFAQSAARPTHPTLSRVWPAAGIAEREMFEMLGVPFAGNEDLKPLLLEEQFVGNPLRRDFVLPQLPSYAEGLLQERQERGMLDALQREGQGPGAKGQGVGTGNREQELGNREQGTGQSGSGGILPLDDGRLEAAPTDDSRQDASAPREKESRQDAGAPSDKSGQGRPPSGESAP